jgi:hypothetical protein
MRPRQTVGRLAKRGLLKCARRQPTQPPIISGALVSRLPINGLFSTTSGPNWHTKNAELYVGSTIPDSLMLNTMPIAAKDQIGLLKDFKFVKAADDKILLVDPATRKIVDTVTKEDAQ